MNPLTLIWTGPERRMPDSNNRLGRAFRVNRHAREREVMDLLSRDAPELDVSRVGFVEHDDKNGWVYYRRSSGLDALSEAVGGRP